jgi:hypothetical protein
MTFAPSNMQVEMLRPRETISAELIDLLGLYDELVR